jgi:hypothetical protein
MANYKLKALSIHMNGRVYLKEEGFVFNEKNTSKTDLENAVNAGFLEEVKEVESEVKTESKAKPKK